MGSGEAGTDGVGLDLTDAGGAVSGEVGAERVGLPMVTDGVCTGGPVSSACGGGVPSIG